MYRGTDAESPFRRPSSLARVATGSSALPSIWRKSEASRHVRHQIERHRLHHAFWDERFAKIARQFPDCRIDQYHIDILAAHFVAHPE